MRLLLLQSQPANIAFSFVVLCFTAPAFLRGLFVYVICLYLYKHNNMIQANELRIGNGLLHNGQYVTVKELSYLIDLIDIDTFKKGYIINESWIDEFQPIPIRPEVLEKCGFELVNHIHGYKFFTLSKRRNNSIHLDVYENKTMFKGYYVNHCQYLHQLQNLYFALTGEELEYKP